MDNLLFCDVNNINIDTLVVIVIGAVNMWISERTLIINSKGHVDGLLTSKLILSTFLTLN